MLEELIKFCVEEVAMNGSPGCFPEDIHSFISTFFARHSSASGTAAPITDQAFVKYICRHLLQQPGIRLERPQAVNSDQNDVESQGDNASGRVGEGFKIYAEPDLMNFVMTGSHVKVPRLTDNCRAVLEAICRSRSKGITIIELGASTGWDQKTIFYFVKILLSADLIVKFRAPIRKTWTNLCVHRRYVNDNEAWKTFTAASTTDLATTEGAAQEDEEEGNMAEVEDQVEPEEAESAVASQEEHIPVARSQLLQYPPIPPEKYLTYLVGGQHTIRRRVLRLLELAESNTVPFKGLIHRVGIRNPSALDRRRFNAVIIGKLVEIGHIQKLRVEFLDKENKQFRVLCLRLNPEFKNEAQTLTEEKKPDPRESPTPVDKDLSLTVRRDLTVERQILDIVEESGTRGVSLNEIRALLSGHRFAHRSIDQAIRKLAEPQLGHLADLRVISRMETYGRERRVRYWTVPHWQQRCEEEGVVETNPKDVKSATIEDPDAVGGFGALGPEGEYFADEQRLFAYFAHPPSTTDDSSVNPGVKRQKPSKQSTGRPRGRPRKASVDLKRPRKRPKGEDAPVTPSSATLDAGPSDQIELGQSTPNSVVETPSRSAKRRGRPPKPDSMLKRPRKKPLKQPLDLDVPSKTPPPTTSQVEASTMPQASTIPPSHPETAPSPPKPDREPVQEPVQEPIREPVREPPDNVSQNRPLKVEPIPPEPSPPPPGQSEALLHSSPGPSTGETALQPHSTSQDHDIEVVLDGMFSNASNTPTVLPPDDTSRDRTTELPPAHTPSKGESASRKKSVFHAKKSGTVNIADFSKSRDLFETINAHGGIHEDGMSLVAAIKSYVQSKDEKKQSGTHASGAFDRRTLFRLINEHIEAGRLKRTVTTFPVLGSHQRRTLVHRPDITPASSEWQSYLERLRGRSAKLNWSINRVDAAEIGVNPEALRTKRSRSAEKRLRRARVAAKRAQMEKAGLVERSTERKRQKRMEAKLTIARKVARAREVKEGQWKEIEQSFFAKYPDLVDLPATAGAMKGARKMWFNRDDRPPTDEIHAVLKRIIDRAAKRPDKPKRQRIPKAKDFDTSRAQRVRGPALDLEDIDEDTPEWEVLQVVARNGANLRENAKRVRATWTDDQDDLLRDAVAVAEVECRNRGGRFTWRPIVQLFPRYSSDILLRRFRKLLRGDGEKGYARMLADEWSRLADQHRDALPPLDGDSNASLRRSLAQHIAFLRGHVDKKDLLSRALQEEDEKTSIVQLPRDVNKWKREWVVEMEDYDIDEDWEFVWTEPTNLMRYQRLVNSAFAFRQPSAPVKTEPEPAFNTALAAVKMIVATNDNRYDVRIALALTGSLGEEVIDRAIDWLQNEGVIVTAAKEGREVPGRQFKFSNKFEEALAGRSPSRILKDAPAFEQQLHGELPLSWEVTATDGQMAALIGLFSDDRLELDIDTSVTVDKWDKHNKSDYSAKWTTDEMVENEIIIHEVLPTPSQSATRHAVAGDRYVPRALHAATSLTGDSPDAEEELSERLLNLVSKGGPIGATLADLQRGMGPLCARELNSAIDKLIRRPVPMVYRLGYDQSRFVHATHIRSWTIPVPRPNKEQSGYVASSSSPSSGEHVFPRTWMTLQGSRNEKLFTQFVRVVLYAIIDRPGITLADLRHRLSMLVDRLELLDILDFAVSRGMVERRPWGDLGEWVVDDAAISYVASSAPFRVDVDTD